MKQVTIALVGNPNCGKTTMFNQLTGAHQYVGNWPGVTVEKKEGSLQGRHDVIITDLPGIYSLSPYTMEEVVSRNYLLEGNADSVLNLVDGSNLERNLYLTSQLLEMGLPVTLAVNMMDVVRKCGQQLDLKLLSQHLGCKIVETSAVNGEGTLAAAEAALTEMKQGALPKHILYSAQVENALERIALVAGDKVNKRGRRWLLVKLFEGDAQVLQSLGLGQEAKASIGSIVAECERQLGDDAESIITTQRYDAIAKLMKQAVVQGSSVLSLTDKLDRLLTNRYLALPLFGAVMFLVYYIAVETIGTIMTDFTNDTLFGQWIMPWAQAQLEAAGAEPWLISLVVDGVIGGISAPLGFAPQMAVVFLLLSFLEDCGYMARVAFIMDRFFRQFGLSGKSFIPLLISSGCAVPGIMSARTIENEAERRLTIMTTSFIPCSAKLPVIALLSGAIMGGEWFMAPIMYFVGFAAVVAASIILKKSQLFADSSSSFLMELPPYHLPAAKNVLLHTWERISGFLKKAGTVIFLCCVVMWFLATYGLVEGSVVMVDDVEHSFVAVIGSMIAPLFAPIGFASWQAVAAAFTGFVAKEAIVSSLAIFAGLAEAAEGDANLWSAVMAMFPGSAAALSFLIFNLLDSPCMAAMATIGKEMNSSKWTFATILFQNLFAYSVCLVVYQLGRVFIGGEQFTMMTALAVVVLAGFVYLLLRPTSGGKAYLAKAEA